MTKVVAITRRRPTLLERLSWCECCSYPLTERHHLLPFSKFGETGDGWVMPLCANCHAIWDLIEEGASGTWNTNSVPLNALYNLAVGKGTTSIGREVRWLISQVISAKGTEGKILRNRAAETELGMRTASEDRRDRLIVRYHELMEWTHEADAVIATCQHMIASWFPIAVASESTKEVAD